MSDAPHSLTSDVLERLGLSDTDIDPLPGDASSRRYARAVHPVHGPVLILSDIPGTPHFENFLAIGGHLRRLGFSAPRIHVALPERGIALIEDFGDTTYTALMARGVGEAPLYQLATDALVALHDMHGAVEIDLPGYDMGRLLDEVALMTDWYAPATGRAVTKAERDRHLALWRAALADVAPLRETLVLRDFHVDNLLLLEDRRGVAACGLLDFQDGLIGAAAYDLVSLTQDARRDVGEDLERAVIDRYLAARHVPDREVFLARYATLGAQRHAKVAGIFHRLNLRDGKPRYLKHVPRVLGHLARALRTADLTDLAEYYDEVMPQWRA